ncbi:conserved hypothetical protein [Ricinus communis]|uniref:Uncharacterized protein n=1 Tax=Ricinus communis TaxID=3988 RepID=B9S2Y9_RICCO|nr:conserved hypothetical protein [Ricinus communis]
MDSITSAWDKLIQNLQNSSHDNKAIRLVAFSLWNIWKARNKFIFKGKQSSEQDITGAAHKEMVESNSTLSTGSDVGQTTTSIGLDQAKF